MLYFDTDRDYLAFGLGAQSFRDGRIVKRPSTLTGYDQYVDKLSWGDDTSSVAETQRLTGNQMLKMIVKN